MALAIVVIAAVIGTVLGLLSGYAGGWADQLVMRFTDIFFSLPAFIVAMAVAVALGRGIVSLVAALSLIWWPTYARLVRGMVLSIKERPHVRSAQALGASRARILRRHVLPFGSSPCWSGPPRTSAMPSSPWPASASSGWGPSPRRRSGG
jgi:peptide/nickel transport system permease protein